MLPITYKVCIEMYKRDIHQNIFISWQSNRDVVRMTTGWNLTTEAAYIRSTRILPSDLGLFPSAQPMNTKHCLSRSSYLGLKLIGWYICSDTNYVIYYYYCHNLKLKRNLIKADLKSREYAGIKSDKFQL